jgi:hypothetical protein
MIHHWMIDDLSIESLNDTSFNDYKKSIKDDAFIKDRSKRWSSSIAFIEDKKFL